MVNLGYFLLFSVILYLAICTYLYFRQESFIFYPIQLPADFTFSFSDTEELYFQKEGVLIHALRFEVSEAKGVVLYFHGNAGALDSWGYNAEDFRQRGYEVWMPDYRTYGKSRGPLSEKALLEDAAMVYERLRQTYPAEQIILYGRSLGSGVACVLAAKVESKLLILETPYSSLGDMAQLTIPPFIPVRWLLRYRLNSKRNIRRLKCPVHLFHGTVDELIPYNQAQVLTRRFGSPDILTTIQGGGHNNLPDFEAYQRKLDELLR